MVLRHGQHHFGRGTAALPGARDQAVRGGEASALHLVGKRPPQVSDKHPPHVQIIVQATLGGVSRRVELDTSRDELARAILQALAAQQPASSPPGSRLPSAPGPFPSLELLTEGESRILRLMADGLTKKEIAASAEISVHTVSTHVRSIYEKLQVTTNTGAVAKALREHLI
jgi:DNA-binding NarL/FixJ family response regulator